MPLGVVLLVALLLLLVDLFDRVLIANPLASLVEKQTGRSLQTGNFDLRWGWPLSLHAEDVDFANADWGSEAPLLHAPAVSVSINPLELLDGPPYADLHLWDPQLLIERSEEGKWNWLIDTGPAEPEEAPRLPVTIGTRGGNVVYGEPEALAIELHHFSLTPVEDTEAPQELDLKLRASHAGMPLAVDGVFAGAREGWEGNATLRAGESGLTSQFSVETGADPFRVRASIDSDLLVPARLAELQPVGDESREAPPVSLPRLEGIDAELEIAVATLRLRELDIEDMKGKVSIKDGHVQLADFMARVGNAGLEGSLAVDTTAPEPAIRVTADLPRVSLSSLPESLPLSAQPGEIAARLDARLEMPDRQLALTPAALLSRLAVPESRFLYAMEKGEKQAALIAHLRVATAGDEPSVSLQLEGVEAPPFDATLSAPPLSELVGPTGYPVQLAVNTEGAQARIDAQLGEVLRDRRIELAFSVSGNELPALPAFGFAPPPVPEFDMSGSLHQEARRWTVRMSELTYGPSRLSGSAVYDLEGERPALALDVEGSLLDLTAIPQSVAEETAEEVAESAQAWISEGLANALQAVDADVELSVERIKVTDDYSLSQVNLAALLNHGRLQVDPVAFHFAGGTVRGSLSAQGVQSPVEGQLALAVEDLELRQFGDSPGPLEDHLGRLSGALHLSIAEARPGQRARDVPLPTLGRLSMDHTRLRFQNADAGTDLTLRFASGGLSAPDEERELVVRAEGHYRGEPVQLEFQGEPLLALRDPHSPYELQAQLDLAGGQAQLDGQVVKFWEPQFARFEFSGRAEHPAPLEALLEPFFSVSLPAFDVEGIFGYEPDSLSLQDFAARFADSDLQGDASLDLSADIPAITASLHSNELHVDDVTGFLNGDKSGEDKGVAGNEPESGYVLSQQRFDFDIMRRADAAIDYTAEDMDAAGISLGSVAAKVRLQDGHLVAEPVNIETANGTSKLRVDMYTRRSILEGLVEVEARGLSLSDMLSELDIASESFGIVGGQGKFWVRGDSMASVIGSAGGGLMLLMTGGELDSLLVEVAGLDIGEAALVASGLYEPAKIDCAYASLHSNDGVLDIDQFVIDTSDTTFYLNGMVDLGEETLDLALFPEAKDPSFPTADSPLAFTGSLKQPEVNVLTGELAARALGAVALAALAGPVAAILPFIETGLHEEPDECKGWVDKLQIEHDDES